MKNVSVNMVKFIVIIALCGINAQAQEVIPNDTLIVETELNETSVVAKKVHHNSDRDQCCPKRFIGTMNMRLL